MGPEEELRAWFITELWLCGARESEMVRAVTRASATEPCTLAGLERCGALQALQPQSLRSRSQQGRAPCCLLQPLVTRAPPPFLGLQGPPSHLCTRCFLGILASHSHSAPVSVQCLLLQATSPWIRSHSNGLIFNLLLSLKTVSKSHPIHRSWSPGLRHAFLGDIVPEQLAQLCALLGDTVPEQPAQLCRGSGACTELLHPAGSRCGERAILGMCHATSGEFFSDSSTFKRDQAPDGRCNCPKEMRSPGGLCALTWS